MRVLITGHRGYIGSVLSSVLRHRRHEVVGLDADWFAGCDFGRSRVEIPCFDLDMRDIGFADLASFDAVVHLAGLSDDASAELGPELTEEINHTASVHLASACRDADVSRFVLASTCSVYGTGGPSFQDERAPAKPLTCYAKAKLAAEEDILALARPGFTPIALRLATVYGVSPRLRLDLVVNDFVASAVTAGRIRIESSGQAWRPVVHVEDVARAIAAVVHAEEIPADVYNVVAPGENYRVIDIADAVAEVLPQTSRAPPSRRIDERSYRVDGSKFLAALPGFDYRWTLARGIRQLCSAFLAAGLTAGDSRCDRFRRSHRLRTLMEGNVLDQRMRRLAPARRDAEPVSV